MAQHHHYQGGEAARFISKTAQPYHVFIASPSGRGFPTGYVMALPALVESLVRFGIRFDYHVLADDCHVDDARNKVFREFLKSGCSDIFFIDSDIASRPQDFIKLLRAEGDIVTGIYRHKDDAETYPFHPGEGAYAAGPDGLFDVPKAPTGFMRIRRHVIAALHADEMERGRFWWENPEDEASGNPAVTAICERVFSTDLRARGISDELIGKVRRNSGDLVLCIKARQLGFSVRVDIELEFGHIGEKEWRGCLASVLRRDQRVDHPEFIVAVDALQAGKADAPTFHALNAYSGNAAFALPGSALLDCWNLAKRANGPLLELGSGLSTLVIGLALAGSNNVLHAFESDLDWFKHVGALLARHGVKNVALHYLPLMPFDGFDWYGYSEEMGLPASFDAVLIDGPERSKGSRDGAFKVIPNLLENARVWFVDDMGDPRIASMVDEHGAGRTIERKLGMSGGLPHHYAIASKAA